MIVLGSLIIVVSVIFGFVILLGIGMSDAPSAPGWETWSQLWPAYLGIVLGVAVIAAKFLP